MGRVGSSVAGGAGVQGLDFPVALQLKLECGRVGHRGLGRRVVLGYLPGRCGWLRFCARDGHTPVKAGGRIPVTLQAKGHAHGLHLAGFIHIINGTMAIHAVDAAFYVDSVVKIDEIRQGANSHPRDRLPCGSTFAHQVQARVVFQDLVVAIQAGGGGREAGDRGGLDRRMAISAVEGQ